MTDETRTGPRPVHHLDRDEAEIDKLFEAVRECFGQAWLDQQASSTVGALWHRRDPSATNQLVILGAAVQWAASTHPSWLRRHTKTLKSRDANERKGAMLELLAMHLLHRTGTGVSPTPQNFPGYDAVLTFADGAELALSIKNYGRSAHERLFQREAQITENAFTAALKAGGRNGLMLTAWAEAYPTDAEWRELRSALPAIVSQGPLAPGVWTRGRWMVGLVDTPAKMLPISRKHLSHQVLIAVPFHANESKNLLDKLEGAAANARRHSQPRPGRARAVLVRIPESLPPKAFVAWCETYLKDHANGPIDMVIVYQVANINDGESTGLHHTIIPQVAASYVDWLAKGRVLITEPEVGTAGMTASRLHIAGLPDGALDGAYVHQSGTWHRLALTHPDGAIRGDLSSPAPGVNVRSVVRMPQGEFVIEGLFPPDGAVTLFD